MKTKAKELWEIRPLEWAEISGAISCDTVAGLIRIKRYCGAWEVWVNYAGTLGHKRYATVKSAKTAAEKWYHTQLKKALIRGKP